MSFQRKSLNFCLIFLLGFGLLSTEHWLAPQTETAEQTTLSSLSENIKESRCHAPISKEKSLYRSIICAEQELTQTLVHEQEHIQITIAKSFDLIRAPPTS